MGSKPSFVTDFSELPTPVPEEQAGIVTDFSKMPLPGGSPDVAVPEAPIPSQKEPVGVSLGQRLGAKIFSPTPEFQGTIHQDQLNTKYGPGKYKVEQDPSVTFGTNFLIKDQGGQEVGETDPQGYQGIGELAKDVAEVVPTVGAGLAAGAAGTAMGGPIAGALAAGSAAGAMEGGRQAIGKALWGGEMDPTAIAFSAGSELVAPGIGKGLKAGSKALKSGLNKSKAWLATSIVEHLAKGSTAGKITPDSRAAMLKYFRADGPAEKSVLKAGERVAEFEAAQASSKNTGEALSKMGSKIFEPISVLRKEMDDVRVAQRMAYEDYLGQTDNLLSDLDQALIEKAPQPKLNQYGQPMPLDPEEVAKFKSRQADLEQVKSVIETKRAAGAKAFRTPSLDGRLPPSVPISKGNKRVMYEIEQKLSDLDRDNPAFVAVREDLNTYIKNGRADLDDLLGLKERLNAIEFKLSDGNKNALPQVTEQAIHQAREMVDAVVYDKYPKIGQVMGEYTQFKRAFPSRVTDAVDEPQHSATLKNMIMPFGGGATVGFALTQSPLYSLTIGAGALGAHLVSAASSKPALFIRFAKYAAVKGNPMVAHYLDTVASMGKDQADTYWSRNAPDMIPQIQAALPQIFAGAMRDMPDYRQEMQDSAQGMPTTDRAKIVNELNQYTY